ncbi:MAG: hypothetical protein H0V66_15575 [Bdellovibrionales bacterium]|nr:hypothetical protein [Bdellovibrionales bacterium]
MKFMLMMILVLASFAATAKNVKDFNKTLIQDVQKDLNTDNDQTLKKNNAPMRGPASVNEAEVTDQTIQEDSKINKKDRQLGNSKW